MKFYYYIICLLCTFPALAQVYGCTDPMSINYNPNATVNNGSCTYESVALTPQSSATIEENAEETSGLIQYNGLLYTHNDDTDTNLYGIDPATAEITSILQVTGALNKDWEDIDQDAAFIYIADTGNNASGNRNDLRIIRATKAGLQNNTPQLDYIYFNYDDQVDLNPTGSNNTDFDCEAIIVGIQNIYLFTKQWVSQQTSVYMLPKEPGTYTAQLIGTYDVGGLITGATWLQDSKIVALCGYTTTLQPFIYLLYDYSGDDFFSGNIRRINISLPFYQMEAITTTNGMDYYLSNERFQQGQVINVPQQLHYFDLSQYTQDYIALMDDIFARAGITIYPNPASDILYIEGPNSLTGLNYYVTDVTGKVVVTGLLESSLNQIDVATLRQGIYTVTIGGYENGAYKLAIK